MNELLPISLVVLLVAISGDRFLAKRSLTPLSVEEKARVLEASSESGVWVPICLALLVAALSWLPITVVPPYYRPGILAIYVAVPFLLSLASRITTYLRLSRLGLPAGYLRAVRLRALLFHLALLFLVCALIFEIFDYSRRRQHAQSPNQATMEPTPKAFASRRASRRTTKLCMSSTRQSAAAELMSR